MFRTVPLNVSPMCFVCCVRKVEPYPVIGSCILDTLPLAALLRSCLINSTLQDVVGQETAELYAERRVH
jgi:hypothetical protein